MENLYIGVITSSAWMLPLVLFCVLMVLGVQYVHWPAFRRKARLGRLRKEGVIMKYVIFLYR